MFHPSIAEMILFTIFDQAGQAGNQDSTTVERVRPSVVEVDDTCCGS